ncbi:hypothetical protein MKW98_015459 [Papaver atlanticum]|uniref:Uncharacterized protein n=1 Tax=Papaver atlanticum TaxID=357466 RepID=A0AAD4X6A0_9MAGN|nr:hypothetical protein MKW98_015459 [Papaver atlanticum]
MLIIRNRGQPFRIFYKRASHTLGHTWVVTDAFCACAIHMRDFVFPPKMGVSFCFGGGGDEEYAQPWMNRIKAQNLILELDSVDTLMSETHELEGSTIVVDRATQKVFHDAIEALRVSYKKMNPFCVPFATTNMGSAMLGVNLLEERMWVTMLICLHNAGKKDKILLSL